MAFPDGPPGPVLHPAAGGRELLPHRVSTGDTHCLHPWGAGAQAAAGHGPPASVPHPGEGEVLPNPSRSPPFQSRRVLLLVPGACPGTGGGALPARPRGRRCGAGTACGGQRGKVVKTEQTKNHPQPWGAQLPQRRLFPGPGGNPSQGAKRRSASPPSPDAARPLRAASRRREPGGEGLSPGGAGRGAAG